VKPKDLPLFKDKKARKVLDDACRTHGVRLTFLQELIEIERKYSGSGRAMGITNDLHEAFGEQIELQRVGND
jgi:hypothetical protein